MLYFEHLIFGKKSRTLQKPTFTLNKFTSTKHELDKDNICENDSFTAPSRFYRYTDEEITQLKF